jgi:hypothetical protein
MQFSEDDLRSALQRKDPGPEFTQRVMEAVERQKSARNAVRKTVAGNPLGWRGWLGQTSWRAAIAGAMAAMVLAVAGWYSIEGYENYILHMRNQKMQEQKLAHEAEQQAIRALRITSAKLNHVFQKVNGTPSPEPRIRRQSL